MGDISYMVTKSLLEPLVKEERASLLQFLPQEKGAYLKSLEANFHFATPSKPISDILHSIHHSWFIPILERYNTEDKKQFITCLSGEQSEYLRKHFSLPASSPTKNPLVEHFLQKHLFDALTKNHLFIPEEYLPEHPLNVLVDIHRLQMLKLFDYLGLHDLAIDLKKVIHSQVIKKVSDILSAEEMLYVKKIAGRKDEVQFGPLRLEKWDGEPSSLTKIIQSRGMNRFAKALFGCHPSLLWHISHKMDSGRAAFIYKHGVDIKNKRARERLIHDILELIPKK